MTDTRDKLPTLVLVRDLMFSSRITAAATQAGVATKVIRDAIQVAGEKGNRLIVDLNQEGFLDAAAGWKNSTGGKVIGFISHVDTETIAQARAAGIDRVISRGQFTQQLASLIGE